MGVRILLDGPCEMSGSIEQPGYPPTLIAVTGGVKNDVLDQPDDEPGEGERLCLYAFAGVCFIDFRDRRRGVDGKHGMYHVVPDGTYECRDCGGVVVSPPSWPPERCTHWASGFHRIDVEVPSVIEAPAAAAEALQHIAEIRREREVGLSGEPGV